MGDPAGVELLLQLSKMVSAVLQAEIRMRGCGHSDVLPLYEVALSDRHWRTIRALPPGSDHCLSGDRPPSLAFKIWGVNVVQEAPDYAGPVMRGRS